MFLVHFKIRFSLLVQISNMDEWNAVTFSFGRVATKNELNQQPLQNYGGTLDYTLSSLPSDLDLNTNTFYFESGSAYRGSQLNSYGGSISYNITFSGSTSPDTKKSPEAELQQRFFEDFGGGLLDTRSMIL